MTGLDWIHPVSASHFILPVVPLSILFTVSPFSSFKKCLSSSSQNMWMDDLLSRFETDMILRYKRLDIYRRSECNIGIKKSKKKTI